MAKIRVEKLPYPEPMWEMIPPKSLADLYVNRKIHGMLDFELLDYANAHGMNLLMSGPTGAGKTMLPRAHAASRRRPNFIVTAQSSMEPGDLFGRLTFAGSIHELKWVDGPVTLLMRFGGNLGLDEINMFHPRTTAALHSALDSQGSINLYQNIREFEIPILDPDGDEVDPEELLRIGMPETVKRSDDLLVWSAYNPGYIGTNRINEAFLNRFDLHLEWGYDSKVEEKLIASKTLLDLAKYLRDEDMSIPCSTNSLQTFEQLVEDLGLNFAIQNFVSRYTGMERKSVSEAFRARKELLLREYRSYNMDPDGSYNVGDSDD